MRSEKSSTGVNTAFALVWSLLKARRLTFLVGLLLMLVNRVARLAVPATTRFIVDDIIGKKDLSKIPWIIAAIMAALTVQIFTSLGMAHTLSKGGQRIVAELRVRIRSHMGRLPISFYDGNRVGALTSRIMSDVEGVRNLIGSGLVEFLGSLLTAAIASVMLLRISPAITAVSGLLTSVFMYSFFRLLKVLWPIYGQRSQILAEVTARLTESLGGVRVVKGFDAEAYEAEEFEMGSGRILAIFVRTINAETLISLLSQVTTGLLGVWVFYRGAHMVIAGTLSLGNYLTYNILLAYILAPLSTAVTEGVRFADAIAGVERALEVLDEETEHDSPERNIDIGRIDGQISFTDVIFGYDKHKPVLHNLSFVAGPNQVIALVGPSGSGKSTIASLICGFHSPQIGKVAVDGVDLRTVKLTSYRRQLGVVFQESFLFRGTIRENVAFAQPDATEEQVLAACRIARVDEFAETFTDKYETLVGERGVTLSGGQRQRVSIARALLRNPRLLILDEASSSLDYKSEAMVQEALAALMRGRTTVVIAHRLSTVRRADLILVVDNGRIVERGTHDELLAAHGKYRSFYDQQDSLRDDL